MVILPLWLKADKYLPIASNSKTATKSRQLIYGNRKAVRYGKKPRRTAGYNCFFKYEVINFTVFIHVFFELHDLIFLRALFKIDICHAEPSENRHVVIFCRPLALLILG